MSALWEGQNEQTRFDAAGVAAAGAVRVVPQVAARLGGRRILELVVDKATGTLRAVERLVD